MVNFPDLVVKGYNTRQLIVELEAAKTLDEQQQHVIEQLEGFSQCGYTRALVLLERKTDAAAELIKDVAAKVEVSTPRGIAELL